MSEDVIAGTLFLSLSFLLEISMHITSHGSQKSNLILREIKWPFYVIKG